jgi:antitoxin MazE
MSNEKTNKPENIRLSRLWRRPLSDLTHFAECCIFFVDTREWRCAMETVIKKWGNSLALRIPKPLADEIGLEEDSAVDLYLEEGKLVIVPAMAPRYALESLLAEVTVENLHDEVDVGVAVGVEAW